MSEVDVFSTDQGAEKGNESILETLVGSGKKFATVEDLARGKKEADDFIEQLKSEKAQLLEGTTKLESDVNRAATIAELIEAVKGVNQRSEESGNNQAVITPEQLQELIKSTLQGEKTADIAKSNREQGNKLVLQKMKGDAEAARAYVAERASKLGMTTKELGVLSEKSPSAFAELMEIKQTTAMPNITDLPHKNSLYQDNGTVYEVDGTPTKAWFDKQKKDLGLSKYLGDNKLQLKYLRAAQQLGERFFNQS